MHECMSAYRFEGDCSAAIAEESVSHKDSRQEVDDYLHVLEALPSWVTITENSQLHEIEDVSCKKMKMRSCMCTSQALVSLTGCLC